MVLFFLDKVLKMLKCNFRTKDFENSFCKKMLNTLWLLQVASCSESCLASIELKNEVITQSFFVAMNYN